jgi:peptide/nickel transport system substrate-binding protein
VKASTFGLAFYLVSWVTLAGCDQREAPATQPPLTSALTIGFGLASGQDQEAGLQGLARSIALEPLVNFEQDGRTRGRLAESLTTSADGLTLRVGLRSGARFHDGQPVTATLVRDILQKELPAHLGPVHDDISAIDVTGDNQIEFRLKRRSTLLAEGLDILVRQKAGSAIGTGPFVVGRSTESEVEMTANETYYLGRPLISKLIFKPYASIRSAWADMLRGQVDMLYDVGQDALNSLQQSSNARIFTYERPYAYVVVLNVQKPHLKDRELRIALNSAINREALTKIAFDGHGAPAGGAVWPKNWAYDSDLPIFKYDPKELVSSTERRKFVCIFADSSFERLVLAMKRQLQSVGVDLEPRFMPLDQALEEVRAGNFDGFLADLGYGPNLLRPYFFWHSSGPLNWGHYNNARADTALDRIRHAQSDDEYKAGVSEFQRAVLEDPPAIFLVWGERARAVSTRFQVPEEPDRDILSTLRLWRLLDSSANPTRAN